LRFFIFGVGFFCDYFFKKDEVFMYIDFENLFLDQGLDRTSFEKQGTRIESYLEKIEARDQDFYRIFEDDSFLAELEEIKSFSQRSAHRYRDIVVCGIGGSALGIIAIDAALRGKNSKPRLSVLENIDPDFLADQFESLDFSRTLFIVISKSGTTPETLAQYFFVREQIERKALNPQDHLVFVTGPSGFLAEVAKKEDFTTFSVPEKIGGRFSVLTSVGLLPAALLGIDIDALVQGGRTMSIQFLNKKFDQNLPFQLATAWFLSQRSQVVLMPYASALRQFSSWFVQLLAESSGKDGRGLTPIPALGATDQHSQVQLFVDGPGNKLVFFVRVKNWRTNPPISVQTSDGRLDFLRGASFASLLAAEQSGTTQALTEAGVPNITLEIDRIDPPTLGALFLLFEGATAFLGEFLEINAFDQPGVERGKVLTRESLSQKKKI
jgi:glucose-6-phosphate isomerase